MQKPLSTAIEAPPRSEEKAASKVGKEAGRSRDKENSRGLAEI
jgi:hypothetical protein